MVSAARARAEAAGLNAEFICADAEDHVFAEATFDTIISRFGVMFFADPARAFANLRSAAKDDAECWLLAWRSAEENRFMTTAERAAAPLLPEMPPRQPNAPGQFAFADGDKVRQILEAAGWGGIEIEPVDVDCAIPERELLDYVTRLGPLGLVMEQLDVEKGAQVLKSVRTAFEPFVEGDKVKFRCACWMIHATAR